MLVFASSKTIPIYLDRATLRAHDRLQLSLKGSEACSTPQGQYIPVSLKKTSSGESDMRIPALTRSATLCSALLFFAADGPTAAYFARNMNKIKGSDVCK